MARPLRFCAPILDVQKSSKSKLGSYSVVHIQSAASRSSEYARVPREMQLLCVPHHTSFISPLG